MKSKAIAVIPARYGSTRFPGKPLALLAGKPMIWWVYEAARKLAVDDVIVATDDARIQDCVRGFGGTAAWTSPDHPTGTDRIAEAVANLDVDIVINVQGDEPLLSAPPVNELIQRMRADATVQMGTVAVPLCPSSADYQNPNVVKVVIDGQNRALYFSRAPIPFFRDAQPGAVKALRHWGIYGYRKEFLRQFISWPQGLLEQAEKLEQLRALEHGVAITVVVGEETGTSIGVDTPEDLKKAEQILLRGR